MNRPIVSVNGPIIFHELENKLNLVPVSFSCILEILRKKGLADKVLYLQ